MLRALFLIALLSVLPTTLTTKAAIYAGGNAFEAGRVSPTHPAGSLFPGIIFGDPSDHADGADSIAALLSTVNDFSDHTVREDRSYTLASLYGDTGDRKADEDEHRETSTTIPVIVGGAGRNQGPIDVFTGTDTTQILTQLFSGILNVDEDIFAERRRRQGRHAPVSAGGSRSASGHGSTVPGDGNFLVIQNYGVQGQGSWVESTPIMRRFDGPLPEVEDRQPMTNSQLLTFILTLLNPYFYGALFLLLLFAIAWSMRSRFIEDDPDL